MPQTVLVLHGGALGDCVLAVHFARAIRDVAPPLVGGAPRETRVALAARSSIVHWAAKHDLIDGAHSLDAFLRKPTRHDLVVSLLGGSDGPVSLQLRADLQVEPIFIDPRPNDRSELHIVEQWLSKLDPHQSVERQRHDSPSRKAQNRSTLLADPESRRNLKDRAQAGEKPVVLIHPGSGGLSKCVPVETLVQLIPAFRRAGWAPAWMIGPDERERFGEPYERTLAAVAPVIYEESVVAAADLVAEADAFIGMDAGMTHVAALAGVNTLALFGLTDPALWRPLGRSVQTLPFSAVNRPDEVVRCVLQAQRP